MAHTPSLWKHITRPIQFTLVVDDFRIKFVGKEHADHLLSTLQKDYTLDVHWTGSLYCGINLEWNYEARTLEISMPGYIKRQLQKYTHQAPNKPLESPYPAPPKKYGGTAQDIPPEDTSQTLSPIDKKRVQQIFGSILYYARAVDSTVLVALSSIAS